MSKYRSNYNKDRHKSERPERAPLLPQADDEEAQSPGATGDDVDGIEDVSDFEEKEGDKEEVLSEDIFKVKCSDLR